MCLSAEYIEAHWIISFNINIFPFIFPFIFENKCKGNRESGTQSVLGWGLPLLDWHYTYHDWTDKYTENSIKITILAHILISVVGYVLSGCKQLGETRLCLYIRAVHELLKGTYY